MRTVSSVELWRALFWQAKCGQKSWGHGKQITIRRSYLFLQVFFNHPATQLLLSTSSTHWVLSIFSISSTTIFTPFRGTTFVTACGSQAHRKWIIYLKHFFFFNLHISSCIQKQQSPKSASNFYVFWNYVGTIQYWFWFWSTFISATTLKATSLDIFIQSCLNLNSV